MKAVKRLLQTFRSSYFSLFLFTFLSVLLTFPASAAGYRSWLKIVTDLGLPTPPPGTPWEQLDMIANTFFVVALLILLFVLGSRNLKRLPETKFQMLLEICIGFIVNFFGGILGKHGKQYSWFVGSYFIFILFLNYLGLIPGFQSPTADLNTTVAFGLIAVIGVNVISIKENGIINHIKHFWGDPWYLGFLMFPLHVIGEVARAASLALRLFGNIFGEETVIIKITVLGVGLMTLLASKLGGFWLPIPVQIPILFFGMLGGFLQAFVFSLLTSVYIVTFLDHGDDHH
ncbi:MAG: F0F1 ATP synthase subunit A [Candidatus Poribacteria bacterium]|nr:F0F1 ATP synthase subunit A [Candidatus Poribacteria bacterium]